MWRTFSAGADSPLWWAAPACTWTPCVRGAPFPTSARRPGFGPGSRQSISDLMDICPEYANIEEDGVLRQVDPETAARLHPHDAKRIIRALEVWYDTGQTISQHNRQTQTQPPRYQGVTIALTYRDRQDLYQRIDQRVDQMMARGLAEEVRALLAAGIPRTSTAMQAIGYKELVRALDAGRDLAPAVEEIKRRSRQYAKRQLTWFRRKEDTEWILLDKMQDFSSVVQISTDYLREKGLP